MNHTATVKGGLTIRPVLFCGKIRKSEQEALGSLGFSLLLLPPASCLSEPVNTHPDMLFARLSNGKLLASEHYLSEHTSVFSRFSKSLISSPEQLSQCYPDDTVFNAFSHNGILFGGEKTSALLKASYPHFEKVKQGYAHCATAKVGDGYITADRPLANALARRHIPVLLIRPGAIVLAPYDTGFIGGASLTLSERVTAFFGKIEAHPDYTAMKAFADRQNTTLLSLSNEPLADFGGGYLLT